MIPENGINQRGRKKSIIASTDYTRTKHADGNEV